MLYGQIYNKCTYYATRIDNPEKCKRGRHHNKAISFEHARPCLHFSVAQEHLTETLHVPILGVGQTWHATRNRFFCAPPICSLFYTLCKDTSN